MKSIGLIDNYNVIEALGENEFQKLANSILGNRIRRELDPNLITFDITQFLNDSEILEIVDIDLIIQSKERMKKYNLKKSVTSGKRAYALRASIIINEINQLKKYKKDIK